MDDMIGWMELLCNKEYINFIIYHKSAKNFHTMFYNKWDGCHILFERLFCFIELYRINQYEYIFKKVLKWKCYLIYVP